MHSAVALVGGWAHPADQTGPAVTDMLESIGFAPTLVDHPDGLPEVLADQDLLVIHGCFFQMLDDRYTPEQREEFSYLSTSRFREAISGWVAAGRPVLAMHTAVLCFDDWDAWPAIAGAQWDWARSYHPPLEEVEVHMADDPRTAGLEGFTVSDERYTNLVLLPDVDVVATASSDGVIEPAAWIHRAGSAPVVYDALGHDARSLGHSGHRALVAQLLDQVL
ncbi:MAG: ThuA domain-containing protein [Acidimicrobiales bacterium]